MKLFYITSNIELLKEEFKITNEELLKIGNLNMIHIAEDYYNGKLDKDHFKKVLETQIEEVRLLKIDTIK